MNLLVCIFGNPFPPNSGPKVRNANLWKVIEDHKNIRIKIAVLNEPRKCNLKDENFPNDYICYPYQKPKIYKRIWRILNYSFHQYKDFPNFRSDLTSLIQDFKPDIIHFEELRTCSNIGFLRESLEFQKVITATLHNVERELLVSNGTYSFPIFQSAINQVHLKNLINLEKEVIMYSNKVFCYSKLDQKIYENYIPSNKWSSTSNGANVDPFPPPSTTSIPMFMGSLDYSPNKEGLSWLLENNSDHNFTVVGARPPIQIVKLLESQNITLHSNVPDIREYYKEAQVLLVPIFSGSGTRTKILEAIGFGRLVLTTSKGIEGINLNDGDGVFIADNANEWNKKLDYIKNLSKEQYLEFINNGIKKINESFSWDKVAQSLISHWENCLKTKK